MYTKYMKEKYWFRVHKLRFGWAPNTWKGWMVVIVYLVVVVYTFFQVDSQSHSVSDTLYGFVPKLFALSALLIIITYLKGEPLTTGRAEKLPKNTS